MIDLKRGCYTATKPCGCVDVGDIVQPGQPSNSRLVQTCQQHLKQAQIAALRVRLGDIAAGASGFGIYSGSNTQMAISWAIMELFKVPVCYTKCGNLDSLAAWLWERGVR